MSDGSPVDVDVRLSRRKWLRRTVASVVVGGAGVGVYSFGVEPHWIEIVQRSLPIRNLPPSLRGKRVVQISDLHIGTVVQPEYIRHAFGVVNQLSPDILVITGDIVNGTDKIKLSEAIGLIESSLSMDRMATVACLGNHDYGRTWNEFRKADELTDRLRELGMTVLRDESTNVDGLVIAGLEDRWGTNWDGIRAASVIEQSDPDIVLCHNPDVCDESIWGDFHGWILSGHTHGGQCKPPFLPPPITPVRNKRYTSGEFELSGERKLYINRAIGYLHRVRFLVRPEITVFNLCEATS